MDDLKKLTISRSTVTLLVAAARAEGLLLGNLLDEIEDEWFDQVKSDPDAKLPRGADCTCQRCVG